MFRPTNDRRFKEVVLLIKETLFKACKTALHVYVIQTNRQFKEEYEVTTLTFIAEKRSASY